MGWQEIRDVRCSCCVKQNVSVLEVLGLGSVLQVLLQAVAALAAADGRDGCFVDNNGGGAVLGSHGGMRRVSGRCVWVSLKPKQLCGSSGQKYVWMVL
jgi:hypothetical protein